MLEDMEKQDRYQQAIRRFDEINARDPRHEFHAGRDWPKELLYAERMTACLSAFEPNASEALRLAVRSQHIERWAIPRDQYPRNRQGYKRWRTDLAKHHATIASMVLSECGYSEAEIRRVQELLRKEKLKLDPEVQTLEDVACLVFLEFYFDAFAADYTEDKLLDILFKTWIKMSPRGHAAALDLPLSPQARTLIEKALANPRTPRQSI